MVNQGKKHRGTGGFTLVELIVVIAILAILAGVGTVAYTGYVSATKKGVDRQTVGDLIYAATLAGYANPNLLNDSMGIIVVTDNGASASGGNLGDAAFASAISDSVGNLENLSLSYDSWGTKVAAVTGMLDTISPSSGADDNLGQYLGKEDAVSGKSVTVGYADVANEYWKVVESAARSAANSDSLNGFTEEMAAQLTVLTAYATSQYSTGKEMGTTWASTRAPETGCLNNLYGGVDDGAVAAGHAISKKGANLARNMAFAQYLKKHGSYEGVDQDIAKLLDTSVMTDQVTSTAPASGHNEAYSAIVNQYLSTPVFGEKSQAYIDGLAYYTFMKSLDTTYGDYVRDTSGKITGVNIGDNFWKETDNHISWAAAVGSGKISVDAMRTALRGVASEDNAIIVMVDKTKGYLKCTVFPVDADPRDGDEDEAVVETAPTKVTSSAVIDLSAETINPSTIALSNTTSTPLTMGTRNSSLTIPAGYTISSIEGRIGNTDATTSGSMKVGTEDSFTLRLIQAQNGTTTVVLLAKDAKAGTSKPVSITFTLASSSDSSTTLTKTINFTLWAIG